MKFYIELSREGVLFQELRTSQQHPSHDFLTSGEKLVCILGFWNGALVVVS